MAKLRLLERFAALDIEQQQSSQAKLHKTVKSSVINHVQRLLNTRPGSALIDENFGVVGEATQVIGSRIPDPHEMTKNILTQLHAYEPRLKDCMVDIDLNDIYDVGINLNISGIIEGDNSGERLQIAGKLFANGTLEFDSNR